MIDKLFTTFWPSITKFAGFVSALICNISWHILLYLYLFGRLALGPKTADILLYASFPLLLVGGPMTIAYFAPPPPVSGIVLIEMLILMLIPTGAAYGVVSSINSLQEEVEKRETRQLTK